MIRTTTFKINTSDKTALLETMKAYTVAFNTSSEWGFSNHTANKIENNRATYYKVREEVPNLTSNLVQCARDVACESLKHCKCKVKPIRKTFGAMRYNKNVININMLHGIASIATVNGRIKASFFIPNHHKKYTNWNMKSSTISYNKSNKNFYLHVSFEHPNPSQIEGQRVLGIDRGIVNLAVCSDNSFYNSNSVKNVRAKFAHLRAELQSKGTRSARRKLRKISGRERRFVTDVNHCISKKIVNSDYTVFALENLSKIRVQKRRGKEFNRKLNTWSFYQFEQFIKYKAEEVGKQIILVDARFTSQKCSKCGHVYKGNRHGSEFHCRSCGFDLHADLNASRNIAQAGISCLGRLLNTQPNVTYI